MAALTGPPGQRSSYRDEYQTGFGKDQPSPVHAGRATDGWLPVLHRLLIHQPERLVAPRRAAGHLDRQGLSVRTQRSVMSRVKLPRPVSMLWVPTVTSASPSRLAVTVNVPLATSTVVSSPSSA